MKWDRQTVRMVVIVFVTVAFTSWIIKFAIDHDGETITIGGPEPSSQVAADPGSGGSGRTTVTTSRRVTPTRRPACRGSSRTTCRCSPRGPWR